MPSIEDFQQLELRVGRVVQVDDFPDARKPAYKLRIDFGTLGIKQSSAQITKRYSPDELVGRQVIAVTNLPPKRVAGFLSEVLVLGVDDGNGEVVLLGADTSVPVGSLVS